MPTFAPGLQLGTLLEVSAISLERSRGVSRYNALTVFEAIRCAHRSCRLLSSAQMPACYNIRHPGSTIRKATCALATAGPSGAARLCLARGLTEIVP